MSDLSISPTATLQDTSEASQTRRSEIANRESSIIKKREKSTEESSNAAIHHLEKRETSVRLGLGIGSGFSSLTSTRKDYSEDVTQTTQTKTKQPKAAWKTSRFFSRTLSSGELLKSLKKLSTSSSEGNETEVKFNEAKLLKTKLNIFRKRSGSDEGSNDSQTGIQTAQQVSSEEAASCQTLGQEEGIVFKREDLISIIQPMPEEVLGCITKRTPLRYTRSETVDSSSIQKSEFSPCTPDIFRKRIKSRTNQRSLSDERKKEVREMAKKIPKNNISDDQKPIEDQEQSSSTKEIVNQETPGQLESEHGTVLWDDGNVLNAMLLGDAIESFLKGSMSSGGGCEKRVSFKKS